MRLLVVTAVAAERDSAARGLRRALGEAEPVELPLPGGRNALRIDDGTGSDGGIVVDVLAAGVGPAAAAAGTAAALATGSYDLVVSAGIAGGFAPAAPVGSVVVADAIVAADLGAEASDGGFVPVEELGFGTCVHRPPDPLSRCVAGALGADRGAVLTLSTMTGTAARAAELAARHPSALAEAMEGFGVAESAAAHGLPVLEIRTISNPVGPRDRSAWRIGDALAALTDAFGKITPALEEEAAHE